jgi:hypothetical protein
MLYPRIMIGQLGGTTGVYFTSWPELCGTVPGGEGVS